MFKITNAVFSITRGLFVCLKTKIIGNRALFPWYKLSVSSVRGCVFEPADNSLIKYGSSQIHITRGCVC